MEEVLRRFARLAGLTVEEAEQWQDLCGDAYVLLESQRKKQKDASCVGDLVCAAAAALAFYQYTLHQNAAGRRCAHFSQQQKCGVGKIFLA